MRNWLYNTALTLATPFAAGYLAASRRYRPLLQRFSPDVPELAARPIWLHACSVGEVGVAQPLLAALQRRYPDVPLLLTTSTITGRERADHMADQANVTWFPFDHPRSVAGFLSRANPRLLILIETELWPNVLRRCHQRRIPSVLVNGRLSDRHFHRYQRLGAMARRMMACITAAGVQDDLYARRFEALGLEPGRIHITGNLKFDGIGEPPDAATRAALRAECGIGPGAQVIVCGSSRPGDEQRIIDCWRTLRSNGADPYLVVAPRHTERAAEIAGLFEEPVRLRSEDSDADDSCRAIVVDTHGELFKFYSLATVAVIGGSFDSRIQGHNPIEPAALGVPAVFGPHMRNFAGAAQSLVHAGGAVQVERPDELQAELGDLLNNAARCSGIGRHAQEVVAANRGALDRTMALIAEVCGSSLDVEEA